MDPDFAGLEFPRFTKEDSQVTEQNAAGAPAPAQTPAPAGEIPWIGNLYGAISWGAKAPPAPAIPASSSPSPGEKPTPAPSPAPAPAPAQSPPIVNVFTGQAKGKKKAKPEGEAK